MVDYLKTNHLGLLIIIFLVFTTLGGSAGVGALDSTTIGNPHIFTGTHTVSGVTSISGALSLTSTLRVGTAGTALNRVNHGTCYIRPYAATIVSTSTAVVDCQATAAWDASGTSALTGVTDGDFVQAMLSTSTAGTTGNGIRIIGASASTTPGFIELHISNETFGAHTWPTSGTASGTVNFISSN